MRYDHTAYFLAVWFFLYEVYCIIRLDWSEIMDYKQEFQMLIDQHAYEEAMSFLEKYKHHALDDSFYYANMGWILNHIERFDEAIIYLIKGIQAFPEDPWIYAQIGYSYSHKGQYKESLDYFLKSLDMGQDESWIHGELGYTYRMLERYEEAVNYFENALMEDVSNVWLLAQAGYAYLELGNTFEALYNFNKVNQLEPGNDSLYDLYVFYKRTQDLDKAEEILLMMKDVELVDWYQFELGYINHQKKEWCKACEHYEKSISLGRDDTGVRKELGELYTKLNEHERAKEQYQLAMAYYEKALGYDNDHKWILQEMIQLAQKIDDNDLALKLLKQYESLDKDALWCHYQYANIYAQKDDFAAAKAHIELLLQEDEDDIEYNSMMGWNLGRLDKHKDALDYLSKVEHLGRDDSFIYTEIAWNYTKLEDYELSLSYYEKALILDTKDAWLTSQIGWNYGMLKQHIKAIDFLDEAILLGRNDGWIYANLGWNKAALGDVKEALKLFEQAEDLKYQEEWMLNKKKELIQVLHDAQAKVKG